MSTQSFVPGDLSAATAPIAQYQSDQAFEQANDSNYNHHHHNHLGHRHEEQVAQVISAHPIGLGCYGASAGPVAVAMAGHSEPVPGASDGSVVMTSSASLSPDDEGFTTERHARPYGLSGRHASGTAAAAAAAAMGSLAAGDCASQLGLGAGGKSLAGANSFLGKLVGKRASRLRELVLQNLGRADRTQDELFDLYEMNFYKQQQQVARLTKEFKLYSTALKSYHEASRSLNKCIQQATTDYQSARHDLVCENLAHLEQLNEDLMEKLHEQVMRSVGEYLSKFDETKEKISKRHRKLIDYDSSRRLYELMLASVNKKRSKQQQQQQQQQHQLQHQEAPQHPEQQGQQNYQSILRGLKFLSQQQQQQSTPSGGQQLHESIASQLVDEARLLKLREQFNHCKLMYENINNELHDELPIVYEKKMKSLLQALQNYYAIKAHYHSNAGKLLNVVSEVIEECPQSINAVLGIRKNKRQSDLSSSSSTNYEDDDDDDDEETGHAETGRPGGLYNSGGGPNMEGKVGDSHNMTGGGGGGAGSSGVGSSRGDSVVDSASSPSGSSSASPECVSGRVSQQSGKADEPAGLASGGDGDEQQHQCAPVSSQSVGEQASESDGPPVVAEDAGAAHCESGAQVEAPEVSVEDAAKAHLDRPSSELVAAALILDDECLAVDIENLSQEDHREQTNEGPDTEEVDIKILDTTKQMASAKIGDSSEENADVNKRDSFVQADAPEGRPFLYKVKTNYKYLAEDVDELCFEADEIIQVIEFDETHEPEDGWLLGIREVNSQRGLFPANFTQPL